jgi:hypothetical protein
MSAQGLFSRLFVRRRMYMGGLSLPWLAGIAFVMAAMIAAAIAVPIAIHNDDDANGLPAPTPTLTTSPTVEGWYWKPGDFTDYAPSGMPDFDQQQDAWSATAAAPMWSHCGPVAVANSLWWFDSKFEPSPVAPPTVNDNYGLVVSYSPVGAALWDDHDAQNVDPFVRDLASRMDTDGQRTGVAHLGTNVEDMHVAINYYIAEKGFQGRFYAHLERSPDFEWIEAEIERCQDVVLLLGFWQLQGTDPTHAGGGEWVRIGGHYVTCAGVNSAERLLGVSDPYWDNAEAGGAGVVPVTHTYPHNASVHNDAQYVSHDIYRVVDSDSPGGEWALEDYASGKDVSNFEGRNWASDLLTYQGDYDPDLPVHVEIDYAVAVSPMGEDIDATPTPRPLSPTPTPTMTAEPTGEPTGRPTITPEPTGTPRATPTPGGQQITGIMGTYTISGGVAEITILVQSDKGPEDIHDAHIYLVYENSGEEIPSGEFYFEDPLPVGEDIELPPVPVGEPPPDWIKIVWTRADGTIIGWTMHVPAP